MTCGDTIIHQERPEWGQGVVTRVESVPYRGRITQRVHVRFSAAGIKVLNVAVARIEVIKRAEVADPPAAPVATIRQRQARTPVRQESGPHYDSRAGEPLTQDVAPARAALPNLPAGATPPNGTSRAATRSADVPIPSRSSLEKAMLTLPEAVRDPFTTVWNRLERTIALYRITDDPRHVTLWAVSQMGLDDPLSIFSRQELEVYFKRWARLRDEHLATVLADAAKSDPDRAADVLATAPPSAREAMRRANARR